MLPAACVVNGLAPPHSRRAIEIKEDFAARSAAMLQDEMPIEKNGLHFRQKGVISVQMRPAGLHHADLRFGKVMHHAHEPVFRGNESSVKDGDELALGAQHAV